MSSIGSDIKDNKGRARKEQKPFEGISKTSIDPSTFPQPQYDEDSGSVTDTKDLASISVIPNEQVQRRQPEFVGLQRRTIQPLDPIPQEGVTTIRDMPPNIVDSSPTEKPKKQELEAPTTGTAWGQPTNIYHTHGPDEEEKEEQLEDAGSLVQRTKERSRRQNNA